MQPILDYYYESYKHFLNIGGEKVTTKTFPEKNIKLDFSGTRFEFLNELKPNVNVYFFNKKSSGYSAYFSEYNRERINTMDQSNAGNIYIDFSSNFEKMYYGTIEHEVLHYIQYLIKKYKKLKNKKEYDYGGLPSRKLIPAGLDTRGKRKEKRTHHEYRPIEYYTNLLSIIRSLERTYEREMRKEPQTYEKSIKDKELKKEFLNSILKAIRQDKGGTADHYAILAKIKKFSKELYQKYLQIIYKVFVEGEAAYNLQDLKKMIEELQNVRSTAIQEREKQKLEKFKKEEAKNIKFESWSRDYLKIQSYDTFNLFDKSPVSIDDGKGISGEEILGNLGLSEKSSKNDWAQNFYFLLPKGLTNIMKLFKNLKKLKNKPWTYELRVHQKGKPNREPTQEEMIQIYDGIYKELKERYLSVVTDDSKQELSNLIDGAYNS